LTLDLSDQLGQLHNSPELEQMISALGVAVYVTDADGMIVVYNDAAAELWGRRPEIGVDQWCGSWRLFYLDGSPMAHADCPMGVTLRSGRAVQGQEAIAERPDGTRVHFMPYPTPLLNDAGVVAGAVNVLVDITPQKAAQAAVEAERAHLQAVLDSPVCGVAEIRPDGAFVAVNDRFCEITGRSREELFGLVSCFDLTHPEDREDTLAGMARLAAGDAYFTIEKRYVRPDGTVVWVNNGVSALRGADGALTGAVIIVLDTTLRRETEDALREREAQLARELSDSRRLQQISSRLIGAESLTVIAEEMVTAAMALMRSEYGSMQVLLPETNELELLAWKGFHPEAAAFWQRVQLDSASTCGVALKAGERIFAVDVDEAAYMAGTEDLHYYRLSGIKAVQSTPLTTRSGELVGMISTHWRGRHEPVERDLLLLDVLARQAADLLEHRRTEALLRQGEERQRMRIEALPTLAWETDAAGRIQYVNHRFWEYSGLPPRDAHDLRTDGFLHAGDANAYDDVRAAGIASGRRFETEARLRRADGAYRWHTIEMAPVLDANDRPAGWIGAAADVDDMKAANDRLLAANSVKDEFLGLVSHELRTPITTILGNAEVLVRQGDSLDAESREGALRDVKREAERLNRVIGDLLTVARAERGALEIEPIALGHAVRDIVREYRQQSTANITVRGDDVLIIASGESGVLSQVLRNYLSNSEKYGLGSAIGVELSKRDGEARVRVLDRGMGIDPAEAERLFDTFYRSKDAGPIGGMGIGLSVCRRLAEAAGGRVWAAARDGGGSEFGLALPLMDEAASGGD
jgi:PAS domain S-box-containing protein